MPSDLSPEAFELNQFGNWLAGPIIKGVGYLHRSARRRIVLLGPIDSEGLVDGGEDIAHAGGAAGDVGTVLVARSHHNTAPDAAGGAAGAAPGFETIASESR